jgi:hypothetical protein
MPHDRYYQRLNTLGNRYRWERGKEEKEFVFLGVSFLLALPFSPLSLYLSLCRRRVAVAVSLYFPPLAY